MGREYSINGAKTKTHRILVGKPEGKRPLGRPRRRWKGDIKMGLKRDRMGLYRLASYCSGKGESGGMKTDRGNRRTQRKPAPALFCPP
jgi:hypothetical protein